MRAMVLGLVVVALLSPAPALAGDGTGDSDGDGVPDDLEGCPTGKRREPVHARADQARVPRISG